MSVDLYEHYMEALRRGHRALAHGDFDAALAAYREAVNLAPDRALPYSGIGNVLLRQDAIPVESVDVQRLTRRRRCSCSSGSPSPARDSVRPRVRRDHHGQQVLRGAPCGEGGAGGGRRQHTRRQRREAWGGRARQDDGGRHHGRCTGQAKGAMTRGAAGPPLWGRA